MRRLSGIAFCLVLMIMSSGRARPIERPAWPLRVRTVEIVPRVRKAWLEDQKGVPFLWSADTCWFLTFRISEADMVHYLEDRAGRGITVVQCMLLPWAREGEDSWFGVKPFVDNKFDQPNEAYWSHVDNVVQAARGFGVTLCMALAWDGCCGEGWSKILNSDHNKRDDYAPLQQYARFIGERYGDNGNVMIFLGGDSSSNRQIFAKMATALKAVAPQMIVAHHSSSWYGHPDTHGLKSSTSADEHGQADYLDVSWTYTYWPGQNSRDHSHPYWLNHIEWNRNQNVPGEVSKVRPFLLGESGYEDERGSPVHRTRRLLHWSIVCGASGQAFGNRDIWPLKEGWKEALNSPGSQALGHMLDIYGKRPWWQLVPEQPKDEYFIGEPLRIAGAETFILAGQEKYDNIRSMDEERGRRFVAAARTPDGTLIMAYFPHDYRGPGIEIDMAKLSGPATGSWIDPHNAQETVIEGSPFPNRGTHAFRPPGKNSFGDGDWVLALETQAK
jgi:hypothetical protein